MKIKNEGLITKIFTNCGTEIKNVRSMSLSQYAGELPILNLEVFQMDDEEFDILRGEINIDIVSDNLKDYPSQALLMELKERGFKFN